MSKEISNSDDIIDSRDIIARIEELESEREDLQTAIDEAEDSLETNDDDELEEELESDLEKAKAELEEWDSDNAEELQALKDFQEEAEGYCSDWQHGETLIRDSHFEDYAKECAEDTGAIPNDPAWPCTCIDWAEAAKELQIDYTSAEFDGVTYWFR